MQIMHACLYTSVEISRFKLRNTWLVLVTLSAANHACLSVIR